MCGILCIHPPGSAAGHSHIGEFVLRVWHDVRSLAVAPDIVREPASFPHPAGRNQRAVSEVFSAISRGRHEASNELRR